MESNKKYVTPEDVELHIKLCNEDKELPKLDEELKEKIHHLENHAMKLIVSNSIEASFPLEKLCYLVHTSRFEDILNFINNLGVRENQPNIKITEESYLELLTNKTSENALVALNILKEYITDYSYILYIRNTQVFQCVYKAVAIARFLIESITKDAKEPLASLLENTLQSCKYTFKETNATSETLTVHYSAMINNTLQYLCKGNMEQLNDLYYEENIEKEINHYVSNKIVPSIKHIHSIYLCRLTDALDSIFDTLSIVSMIEDMEKHA